MVRPLIVGLGRAGLRLHAPVLATLAASPAGAGLFAPGPALGYDPAPSAAGPDPAGRVTVVPSLTAAAEAHPPAETVVHVCTPPSIRLGVLRDLAALGYRRVLVEKPLATDLASLADIERLRVSTGMHLVVVAQWLRSALTMRLLRLVEDGQLGVPRAITVSQLKPRFRRALAQSGTQSAFDVEVPHSLGVALRLAGPAALADAAWSDLDVGGRVVAHLGTAQLRLRHRSGAHTTIFSDLGAPVRERRIEIEFEAGRVTGHYPVSADDEYAQLLVDSGAGARRTVLRDDSLQQFLLDTYRGFVLGVDAAADYAIGVRVAELVCEAKERCLAADASPEGRVRMGDRVPTATVGGAS